MPDRFLGQRIGEYIAEERIGRGAMAVVYAAYQPATQRHVALKVIKLEVGLGESDEFRQRFEQEARVIASLEHIHILPVYDYGIVEGEVMFIAMRLLRGGGLMDLLQEGPVPLDRAADVITQIARGLSYAHRHGIVHRDLKPSNILFDSSGNAYLSDFGLAKVLSRADMTRPGNLVGTPAYVAPEVLRGESVTHRSDIYSLGVLTYEVLTGRPPFVADGGNILSLIRMHLEDEPPRMRDLNPAISPEVEAVVMRALRKDPARRFQDAEDLANSLNEALGRHYSTASYPAIEVPANGVVPARRPRRALVIGAGALLVGLLAVGGWWASRNDNAAVPLPDPVILAGETGMLADVQPTEEDIARAQARLGADGFIAFITCTMESAAQATRAREFADFAQTHGMRYRPFDSENDPYTQITRIERARLDGARGFIICPLDRELLKPTLQSLEEAGLPVVLITLFDPGYGVMLDSDNYTIGLRAGRYGGELLQDSDGGRGNVVILGYPGFPASERRAEGMIAGVLETAPDATIVGVYKGFTREDGYRSIQQLLDQGQAIDVIVSMNDAGSFGAIDALTEAEIPPEAVAISSVNAEPLALEYIREGSYLRGSVNSNQSGGSLLAFDAMVKLLAGGRVPETLLFAPGDVITADTLASEPDASQSSG